MGRLSTRPPSDEKIDRLILKAAVSGRISQTDLDTLATHIHTLRALALRLYHSERPAPRTPLT